MVQNCKSVLAIWPLNHLFMYLIGYQVLAAGNMFQTLDIKTKCFVGGKSHIAIGMTLNDTLCQNPYIFADYHVWQDVKKKRKEKV